MKFFLIKLKNNRLLLAILFLATFLRFVGLVPNISHPDEGHVQIYASELVKNFLTKGDLNPHTFKYGSLIFYLQGAFYLPVLAGAYLFESVNILFSSVFTSKILDYTLFHEESVRRYHDLLLFVGRGQIAIFGVLSVLIVYLIAKQLFNKRTGLISALLLAVAPIHVRDSRYITTDVFFVFWILLSLLFLVYLIKDGKWKWFILSGLSLGISGTIRYFPIALLTYPVAIILGFRKEKVWFLKVLTSLAFVLLGVFLGLPYLFLDTAGPSLLVSDLQKYALPWYGTSISSYFFSLASSFLGKSSPPDIASLLPSSNSFKPIHASWIFFNGFGPLPTIAALMGIVFTLFRSLRKFILLIIIPLFSFIYISIFIPATYERLIIPILPFLAIFAAVFLVYVFQRARRVYTAIVFLVVLSPLLKSFSGSIACAQKSIQDQSVEWIEKNISQDAKIAYLTVVSAPPTEFAMWFALEPGQKLSLEEAREEGADHAFINAGRLDYNTYQFFNSFFIPPAKSYENSYYSLVLAEYQSRGQLLGKVEKPRMCDSSRIYYYRLPAGREEATVSVKNFNFTQMEDLGFWHLKTYDSSGRANIALNAKVGKNSKGVLRYEQDRFEFVPPAIASENIPVKEGEVYTFSFWTKNAEDSEPHPPALIARMDFYGNDDENLLDKISEALLLSREGPTPSFFEKKRNIDRLYNNADLPGNTVALSPLAKADSKWQKVSVTSEVPKNVSFAIFSIQPVSTEKATLYVDDIEFLNTN